MKKVYAILAAVLLTAILFISQQTNAQSPEKMSYQAVIRNSTDNLVTNTNIGMQISILKGSATGTVVYVETQTPTTNANGLVNIEIGGGTGFDTINWANGIYFIKTETDPAGGTNYSVTGTSQLLSVPYALYAETSGENYTAGDGIQINGNNVISTNISLLVSNAGDTLKIVPGNYVIVPGISSINSTSPIITNTVVTNIASSTANCGYTISLSVGPAITTRGVCWDTIVSPTIVGYHTAETGGTGTFTSNITGLLPNKIYYIRAYATNTNGTYYSSEKTFSTIATTATLTTDNVSAITTTTAICGGNINDNGGALVTSRGVCWSTTQPPTISNQYTVNGSGLGVFTSNLTGLSPNTTYYVRAYATNNAGIAYGSQKSFTTGILPPIVITDTIVSISATSATGLGTITSQGSNNVTDRGICWGYSSNPTVFNNKITSGSGTGSFNGTLTMLLPNTTYNIRAYAITSSDTVYGVNKSFTTSNAYYQSFETGYPSGWLGNGWGVTSTITPYDGYNCIHATQENDSLQFSKTITTSPNGYISFYFLRNSGTSYFNIVDFYIDNVLQGTLAPGVPNSWGLYTFSFASSGTHTFKWIAQHQGSSDKVYIDYVIISP